MNLAQCPFSALLTGSYADNQRGRTLNEFFSIRVAAHLVLREHAEGLLHEGRLEVCRHGRPTTPKHNTPSPPPQRQSFEKLQTQPTQKVFFRYKKQKRYSSDVEARSLPTHLLEGQKVDVAGQL